MKDLAVPARGELARTGLLAVPHQHRDLSAQVLFVKMERLFTIAAVVQLGVELHDGIMGRTRPEATS
jgi:hypothetical protein